MTVTTPPALYASEAPTMFVMYAGLCAHTTCRSNDAGAIKPLLRVILNCAQTVVERYSGLCDDNFNFNLNTDYI